MNRFLNEAVNVGREKSRYGITGMMRCQDGWADVIGIREDQWDRLVALPEGAEFRHAGFAPPRPGPRRLPAREGARGVVRGPPQGRGGEDPGLDRGTRRDLCQSRRPPGE